MEKLINSSEFARRAGLPHTTVWRWAKSGAIRSAQPGGRNTRMLIPESELERFLRTVAAGTEK